MKQSIQFKVYARGKLYTVDCFVKPPLHYSFPRNDEMHMFATSVRGYKMLTQQVHLFVKLLQERQQTFLQNHHQEL